jgi:hypothetical protein
MCYFVEGLIQEGSPETMTGIGDECCHRSAGYSAVKLVDACRGCQVGLYCLYKGAALA